MGKLPDPPEGIRRAERGLKGDPSLQLLKSLSRNTELRRKIRMYMSDDLDGVIHGKSIAQHCI